MSSSVWAFLLVATSGMNADESRPVKVLAHGPWPHLPTHSSAGVGTDRAPLTRVVRTEAEFAKAAGSQAHITAAKAFKIAAIDFDKSTIIAIEDGTQPMVGVSGGGAPSTPYTMSIVRIDRDETAKTLTVRWRRLPRGKDQILTRPLEAVLVERFDGEVKFDKLPDPPAEVKELPAAGKEVPVTGRAFWPDGWPPEAARKEWFIRNEEELIDPRLRAPEPVADDEPGPGDADPPVVVSTPITCGPRASSLAGRVVSLLDNSFIPFDFVSASRIRFPGVRTEHTHRADLHREGGKLRAKQDAKFVHGSPHWIAMAGSVLPFNPASESWNDAPVHRNIVPATRRSKSFSETPPPRMVPGRLFRFRRHRERLRPPCRRVGVRTASRSFEARPAPVGGR